MFSVKFKTGNSAFQNSCGRYEVVRILTEIAEKVDQGYEEGKIMDINGNSVGEWKLNLGKFGFGG